MSTSNEDKTEGDIMEMGERLAQEVKNYIKNACAEIKVSKISFVGHSLGGVIIRAALPHLAMYSNKFYTYISLSSPHLGYMTSKAKVVDWGLAFLKKFSKASCLDQLTMCDQPNAKDCFLYVLSTMPGLQWFQQVVLCCSYQDKYVPFDSARI